MKKIISLILCALLASSILCACSNSEEFTKSEKLSAEYTRNTDSDETYNYNDNPNASPNSYNTYANKITDFELKLFRNYYKESDSDSSTLLCAADSALQLSLIANGASDDTQNEIVSALGGTDLKLEALNQCSSYFKSRIQAVAGTKKTSSLAADSDSDEDDKSFVKLQNSLFINDTSDVKKSFMQSNADFYGNDIFRFVFSNDNAATKINNYFSGFSSSAVTSLDENGSALAISASDICDGWLNAYAETDVENGTFKSADGGREVNYMTSDESYIKTELAQGVIKYCASTPLKFIAVLPNEGISLSDYVSDFTYLEYTTLLESMDVRTKATVALPEFTVEGGGNATELNSALESSGLYTLFSDEADFKNLSYSDDFTLDGIFEIQPKLTVNAAGISGQSSKGDNAPLSEHTEKIEENDVKLSFNRPFMFLIIDNESNIPLYIGTVE